MSANNTQGSSSLRPAWYKGTGGGGGRGFQPPPTVTSERGDKGRSGSWGSQERRDLNKFSALQDDDDVLVGQGTNAKSEEKPSGSSRSEAFRSSFSRAASTGNKQGRSLADLASRVPDSATPGRRSYDTRAGSGRFRTGDPSGPNGAAAASSSSIDNYKPDPKVIRYTREKLLSMRAPVSGDAELPADLQALDGAVIVSKTPQDPVCWDTLDAEGIWEASQERRMPAGAPKGPPPGVRGLPEGGLPEADPRRRNPAAPSSGRWQRGVALPPPEEGGRRKERDADNPNELWDDPVGGATGAASDFSAFGAMPSDDADAFDFDKMAEASKELEEELHGSRNSGEGEDEDEDEGADMHMARVDPKRPLASAGMTISSGSGNDVNVFEDFEAPSESAQPASIRGADEDPTASSRLMKMIGVTPPDGGGGLKDTASNPWGASTADGSKNIGGSSAIPLNPWGDPVSSSDGGMDLSALLAVDQRAREAQAHQEMEKRAQEAEMLRRRQEEDQRRTLVQRQAEEQARQQHAQAAAMQQGSQPSQVELVLMERICAILENSWGRSDLVSVLTTLHSEDSRVIPLLGNVDALRALLARSPQRVALRRDPNFSGDMAVLLQTNAQWQQHQQAQAARLQQEEMQRRRMEEEAAARAKAQKHAVMNPDLPWFYSDPQNNIQGPFRGEEMRQWLEAGYFKGDLPISQQTSGPFHPLSTLFPDLSVAFRAVENDTAQEEGDRAAAAAAEEERRRAEAEVGERRAAEAAIEAAERERAEMERQAAEAEAAKANNGGNESSAKLKMMLGLPSELSFGADAGNDMNESSRTTAPSKGQNAEKRVSKGGNKKSQQKAAKENPVPAEPAPQVAKPAAAAWGGAANANPKKSMSEIQQEEARAAALMATQKDVIPQSSSGWANVAAAGTTGWSSGTVKQVAPAVHGANVASNPLQGQARAKPQNVAPTRAVAPITEQQRSSSNASSSTPAEEFGATMPPALETWCKEQMQKINGSDDLTLVGFCMTLPDANEVRQYLTTYLGSTPQVNNFATEFINQRGLGNKQEEWETPGSAKKGRKKKSGGR